MNQEEVKELFGKLSKKDLPLYVIAISILTESIKKSTSTTMMGLDQDIKTVIEFLKEFNQESQISLISGCELFKRYVTRTSQEIQDFNECKQKLIKRGEECLDVSKKAQNRVAKYFETFLKDNITILVFGFSDVVNSILIKSKEQKRFKVIIPECRPYCQGYKTAKELSKHGIPVSLIVDNSMAHVINKVDFILTGAEGVVESGGIINLIGTYQLAIIAKQHKKPFYVASESFKFTREYPLTQTDIEIFEKPKPFNPVKEGSLEELKEDIQVINHLNDFTPPSFITLLFTDLGILTPSAISDELIKLYY